MSKVGTYDINKCCRYPSPLHIYYSLIFYFLLIYWLSLYLFWWDLVAFLLFHNHYSYPPQCFIFLSRAFHLNPPPPPPRTMHYVTVDYNEMIEENFSFVSQATCKKDEMVKYFRILFSITSQSRPKYFL